MLAHHLLDTLRARSNASLCVAGNFHRGRPPAQHLNELLVTDDADVLEALLRLLQRPAQRVSQQRHLKSSLAFSQQRILTLASSWHTKDAGLDLSQLARRDVNIPEGLGMVAFQFYRTAADIGTSTAPGDKSTDAPSNSAPGPATPKPGSGLKTAHATPSAKGKEPAEPSTPVPGKPSGASGPPAEGLVLVTGPISDRPDKQILQSLVEEFSVPEQHNFALLHRIRVTRALQHPDARLQMLRIRVLALSALVQLFPEDVSQSKIFLYEPGLSQRLVDIAVAPDVSRDLQVVALSTLEAIARLRGHLSEVISALNATSNLGPLMSLLRKTLAALDSDGWLFWAVALQQPEAYVFLSHTEPEVPQDYVETVFSLVSFLTTTQSGSPMITSSGVIPALVGLLSNSRPSQLKNVLKATSILDTVVYGFQDGFQMLVTAGGLDVVIQRIEAETRFCVDLAKSSSSSSVVEQEGNVSEGEPPRVDQSEDVVMGDVERPPMDVDGADPTMETIKMDMSPALPINSHAADAPHERLSLLRALLKFVLHMMQTSGTADRLRNLIDSTLPNSLLQVLAFSKTFGPGVFSLGTWLFGPILTVVADTRCALQPQT